MNANVIPIRTCANCCAYEGGECMNGIGDCDPGDRCDQHMSWAEDRLEDQAQLGLGFEARAAYLRQASRARRMQIARAEQLANGRCGIK